MKRIDIKEKEYRMYFLVSSVTIKLTDSVEIIALIIAEK